MELSYTSLAFRSMLGTNNGIAGQGSSIKRVEKYLPEDAARAYMSVDSLLRNDRLSAIGTKHPRRATWTQHHGCAEAL